MTARFDGTDAARCAVLWAAEEALLHHCPLHIVGVRELQVATMCGLMPVVAYDCVADGRTEAALAGMVDECLRHYPDLDVKVILRDGRPVGELADYARRAGANLIAVGHAERTLMSGLLPDSAAAALVDTARLPVVVVRDPGPVQQAAMVLGHAPVVVGIEDVASSDPVLAFAFGYAARHHSALHVVRTEASGAREAPVLAGAQSAPGDANAQSAYLLPWRDRYPDVAVTAVADAPGHALLEQAEEARLLVVGNQRRRTFQRLLFGSVSHTALRHAPCSVAVVPTGPG